MAETLKADQTETVSLTKKAAQEAVAQINGPKENASEHNGVAAKATRDFCDKYGLNKQAITAVCRLKKKEQDTQSDYMRSFLEFARLNGLFNGPADAFADHPVEIMRRIVAEADAKGERRDARENGGGDEPPAEGKRHLSPVS